MVGVCVLAEFHLRVTQWGAASLGRAEGLCVPAQTESLVLGRFSSGGFCRLPSVSTGSSDLDRVPEEKVQLLLPAQTQLYGGQRGETEMHHLASHSPAHRRLLLCQGWP